MRLAVIDGTNNFTDSYTPALGVVVSRELGGYGAIYVEPMWVNNSNPLPSELTDDNDTFTLGIGARLRIRPTVYLVGEFIPRVGLRAGRQLRLVRHREACRRARLPAQFLERLRRQQWASSRAAAPAATTGIWGSTSQGSSSDDYDIDSQRRLRSLSSRSSRPRAAATTVPEPTVRWRRRWRWHRRHRGGDDHDHRGRRCFAVERDGLARPAGHVRQQRLPTSRHGVESASCAHRLP